MRFILIYLLIGLVVMFLLETFWDDLELEGDDLTLNWRLRIEVVLFWPLPALTAILGLVLGGTQNNKDNGDDKDNDDPVGPGFGT